MIFPPKSDVDVDVDKAWCLGKYVGKRPFCSIYEIAMEGLKQWDVAIEGEEDVR